MAKQIVRVSDKTRQALLADIGSFDTGVFRLESSTGEWVEIDRQLRVLRHGESAGFAQSVQERIELIDSKFDIRHRNPARLYIKLILVKEELNAALKQVSAPSRLREFWNDAVWALSYCRQAASSVTALQAPTDAPVVRLVDVWLHRIAVRRYSAFAIVSLCSCLDAGYLEIADGLGIAPVVAEQLAAVSNPRRWRLLAAQAGVVLPACGDAGKVGRMVNVRNGLVHPYANRRERRDLTGRLLVGGPETPSADAVEAWLTATARLLDRYRECLLGESFGLERELLE